MQIEGTTGPGIRRLAPRTLAWLGIVSAVLLLSSAPAAAGALIHLESPASLLLITMLTVGGAQAGRAIRRNPGAGAKLARRALAWLLLLLGAVAAVVLFAGRPAAARRVVEMAAFSFVPETVTAEEGRVTLRLENRDSVRHTFTVDELEVDVNVGPGQFREVSLVLAPGTYRFYCIPHDPRMEGDLIVR
jgi:plastocyanin